MEVVELDEDDTDLPQKDKRKSSQMQRDQSHRKASGHNDEDDEDETEESLHTKRRKLFDVERDKTYEFEVAVFVTNEKKVRKFELLSKEAQNLCIKAVSRLFLFRGTKQEVVTRANILDTLAKIDSEYKTHCDVILEKAQELVLNLTGYLIIDGENIKGCKSASKTDYYLVNTMESSILRSILAEHEDVKRHALNGFAFAVYHSIFNSPGYAIQARDLLQNIRKLDGRFPETSLQIVQKSSSVSALSVPELQSDFLGLLQELRKVASLASNLTLGG